MKSLGHSPAVLAAVLSLGFAIGCGGGGGSISTQPTTPATPAISSLTPSSVVAGTGNTTLTVTGSNFVPSSEITWNGSVRATLYVSATSLQTTLSAADLQTAGSIPVGVENPQADGGAKATSVTFTISAPGWTTVNVGATDLAWDSVNQVIYLSLPSIDGPNGNSIQVLNPATATLGNSVYAGSEPDLLAVSANSKYLYAALDGSSSLQRFNLPGLTNDINISFGPASSDGPSVAMDVQSSPLSDGTVAFVLGNPEIIPEEEGGVHIYDDSTPRPDSLCGFTPESACTGGAGGLYDSIQWNSSASEMYMLDNEDTNADFYTVPVTSSGFGPVTNYGTLAGGVADRLHFDATTGLLYTDFGIVINPATGLKVGQISASGLAATDGKNGVIFYLGQTTSNAGTSTFTIESFDINHLTPIGTFSVDDVVGTPTHLIRWGINGLAFTTATASGSSYPGAVYLISGSFVTTTAGSKGAPTEDVRRSW
jgi:hypothetical protein